MQREDNTLMPFTWVTVRLPSDWGGLHQPIRSTDVHSYQTPIRSRIWIGSNSNQHMLYLLL